MLVPFLQLAAAPKVIDLRKFLRHKEWQLDVTYHAKDHFEDRDHIGGLEMTATASYLLKRQDVSDSWGHWQTLECRSQNLVYQAFWQGKTGPDHLEYKSKAGTMIAPLADLQIGGSTPGYMLIVNGGFPAELHDNSGTMDQPLVLGTSEKDQPGLSGVTSGFLPEEGYVIHGSRVIPFEIPPFLKGVAGTTRMGIQYVLKPVDLGQLTR